MLRCSICAHWFSTVWICMATNELRFMTLSGLAINQSYRLTSRSLLKGGTKKRRCRLLLSKRRDTPAFLCIINGPPQWSSSRSTDMSWPGCSASLVREGKAQITTWEQYIVRHRATGHTGYCPFKKKAWTAILNPITIVRPWVPLAAWSVVTGYLGAFSTSMWSSSRPPGMM